MTLKGIIKMDKKEYVANQLRRTFNKKYENYCITRIYHLLNRNDVQIITQQMFKRKEDGKIALADLYFPQINLSIEIDEPHHFSQKEADKARTREVLDRKKRIDEKLIALGEVVYYELEELRIDVSKNIEDINSQIDNIITLINKRILELGDKFKPWNCCDKSPEDYIKLGKIECRDNVSLRTIQEVSDLFNKGYRGTQKCYFRTNTAEEHVWCPKLKLEDTDFKGNRYQNEISLDGKFIYETEEDNDEFYTYDRKNEVRIVFPKYKDETGSWRYKFKGIYTFNREFSDKTKKAVWEKVGESVDLKQYFQ